MHFLSSSSQVRAPAHDDALRIHGFDDLGLAPAHDGALRIHGFDDLGLAPAHDGARLK